MMSVGEFERTWPSYPVVEYTSVIWPSQHQHTAHIHALAYCAQCDAAYCVGCNRQWGSVSITWTNAWTTSESLPAATDGGTITMHSGHQERNP